MGIFSKLKDLSKSVPSVEDYEEYEDDFDGLYDEDLDEGYEEFDEDYEDFDEDDYEGDNDVILSWDALTAEEQTAVEFAKEFMKDGMSLHRAVFCAVEKVNQACVEEEYVDEEFYGEEADFDIVYSYMKQREYEESN